jgi:cobalamin biosynthesis protein CobT
MKDPAFHARLKSIMLDNKYDRRLRGRPRGKLDMTKLYKVPTHSRSVFTQKQARKGKQYNIVLLVDESGSMVDGSKSTIAAECAVFLAKAFEGLNLNLSIIGFNQSITVIKEFDKSVDLNHVYNAIRTMNFGYGYIYNNDYDALNRAYHMLNKAPSGKNIVIMLSDGEPASTEDVQYIDIDGEEEKSSRYEVNDLYYYEKDTEEHLHALVHANDYRATSIGIGITEGGWQIPNNFVVEDVHDL